MFLIVVHLCEGVCGISVGAFIVVEHGGQDGRARYHGGQEAPQLEEGAALTSLFVRGPSSGEHAGFLRG